MTSSTTIGTLLASAKPASTAPEQGGITQIYLVVDVNFIKSSRWNERKYLNERLEKKCSMP